MSVKNNGDVHGTIAAFPCDIDPVIRDRPVLKSFEHVLCSVKIRAAALANLQNCFRNKAFFTGTQPKA